MSFVTDYVTYSEPVICLIAKTGEILCLPLKDYALFLREAKRFGWNPKLIGT